MAKCMYKAVLFDLDGTLLNTSRDICKVLNGTLSHFNLPTVSLEKTIEYVGNGAKMLVRRAVPEGANVNFEEVLSHYLVHFASCDNSLTTLYPGEEEALNALISSGIKLGIVTNKPQDATDAVYSKLLKMFNFGVVSGGSKRFQLKPDPTATLNAAYMLGVLPKDCLFVGDGETDVKTASNAGMKCLSVLWGYRSKEQLAAAGATDFVDGYASLTKFILG